MVDRRDVRDIVVIGALLIYHQPFQPGMVDRACETSWS